MKFPRFMPVVLAGFAVVGSSLAETTAPAQLPVLETVELGDGVKMEFVLIPAGSFTMGTIETWGEGDESPEHRVIISRPFYLGRCEVTQEQWEKIMEKNPSRFRGPTLPVESVSWNDCQQFLVRLQEKTGRHFSLPTEAQWEYGCRAGTTASWNFGNQPELARKHAWMVENAMGTTHPVGTRKPNPWGLYDMHGNVWEWCADWYAKRAYSDKDATDPQGPKSGESRVLRGGAWGDSPDGMRCAVRNCNGPDGANHGAGLRCVLLIDSTPSTPTLESSVNR